MHTVPAHTSPAFASLNTDFGSPDVAHDASVIRTRPCACLQFSERDRYATATYAAVEAGVAAGNLAGSLVWHLTDEPVDYSAPYYGMYVSHSTWEIVKGHAARLGAAAKRAAPLDDVRCRPA